MSDIRPSHAPDVPCDPPHVIEIGLRLAPMMSAAPHAARDVLEAIDNPWPQMRVVGLGSQGSRVVITLAVAIGTPEQVRSGDDTSREAVVYLHDMVERLGYADPALVAFPEGNSVEAVIAHHVDTQAVAYGLGPQVEEVRAQALVQAVHALAGIGVAVAGR